MLDLMERLPKKYRQFLEDYPEVGKAYEAFGEAAACAGPLDAKTRSLVKLGISTGARLEGAVQSHTRKALTAGASPDEIRQVVILSAPTIGFPAMMIGLTSVEDVLRKDAEERK